MGKLPPTKTVNILRAILKGLGRVHARGVLHLDLKPSNILLSKDGRAVLADFGISRMTHQEEQRARANTHWYALLYGTRTDEVP